MPVGGAASAAQAGAQPHAAALGQLIERIVDVRLDVEQEQALRAYTYRLLGSRLGTPSASDEFQLSERLKRRVATSAGETKAMRFAELYRRFSQKRVVGNRASVLHLLNALSDLGQRNAAKEGTSSSLGLLESMRSAAPSIPDPIPGLHESMREVSISAKVAGAARVRTDMDVPESALVRDVVFAMQGIDGKYVRFDAAADGYVIDAGCGVQGATQDRVRRICECGWLYRRVAAAIAGWTGSRAVGVVGQGLAAGLQDEVSEYFRLVAVLQAHVAGDLRRAEAGPGDDAVPPGGPDGQELTLRRLAVWVQEPLRRLRTMAMLCDAAVGEVESAPAGSVASTLGGAPQLLKGGELATVMCAHARHGDPVVQQLMRRVLRPVCAPILRHVQRWISDGELEDPWEEFFVENDPTREEHHWGEKYKLREEMIPAFVSPALANTILQIGKSINFMRTCCREVHFESSAPHLLRKIPSIEFGQWEELEEVVGALAGEANTALVAALHNQYGLMRHCGTMKRFILFGQGDFVRQLLDLLADSIRPGAAQLYHHNLTGIVETAVRACVAPGEDAEIRAGGLTQGAASRSGRVGVSKLGVASNVSKDGEDLFSEFSLEYRVDAPLNAIVTDDAMRKYKRIFNFLWGIKRVEQALSVSWRRASGLAGIGTNRVLAHGEDRAAHRKLQPSMTVRVSAQAFALGVVYGASNLGIQHQMMHFVSNLQYYVMFEVIECSWAEFEGEMRAAKDLDQLIGAQGRLLDRVLQRVLLAEGAEVVKRQMDRVFRAILDYTLAHQQLCEVAERALARRGAIARMDEEAALEREWGVAGAEGRAEEEEAEEDGTGDLEGGMRPPRALTAKLAVRAAEFVEAFGALREQLDGTKLEATADLRSLMFRLDFSEYYSAAGAAPAEAPAGR